MNKLSFRNLISIDQLSDADIKLIFKKAAEMRRQFQTSKITPRLKGKIAAALFYEPSSRTFASFLAAMQRLGGQVIAMPGMNFSSVAKGETFEDTIKTFSQLADILIVRHPVIGAAERAAAKSKVPIINAGDGAGEHPTQALLDAMTILNHFKNLREVKVGLVGDLKNGRTVHSLLKLLIKIGLKNFYLISPKALRMPAEIGRPRPSLFFSDSGFSGASSKATICGCVKNFGSRRPGLGRARFLIGDSATAPCRIKNL